MIIKLKRWRPLSALRGHVVLECEASTSQAFPIYDLVANALHGPFEVLPKDGDAIHFRANPIGWMSVNFDPFIYVTSGTIKGEIRNASASRRITIDLEIYRSVLVSAVIAIIVAASFANGVAVFAIISLVLFVALCAVAILAALMFPIRLSGLLEPENIYYKN